MIWIIGGITVIVVIGGAWWFCNSMDKDLDGY